MKPDIEWERFVYELPNAQIEVIREKVIDNFDDSEDMTM